MISLIYHTSNNKIKNVFNKIQDEILLILSSEFHSFSWPPLQLLCRKQHFKNSTRLKKLVRPLPAGIAIDDVTEMLRHYVHMTSSRVPFPVVSLIDAAEITFHQHFHINTFYAAAKIRRNERCAAIKTWYKFNFNLLNLCHIFKLLKKP